MSEHELTKLRTCKVCNERKLTTAEGLRHHTFNEQQDMLVEAIEKLNAANLRIAAQREELDDAYEEIEELRKEKQIG